MNPPGVRCSVQYVYMDHEQAAAAVIGCVGGQFFKALHGGARQPGTGNWVDGRINTGIITLHRAQRWRVCRGLNITTNGAIIGNVHFIFIRWLSIYTVFSEGDSCCCRAWWTAETSHTWYCDHECLCSRLAWYLSFHTFIPTDFPGVYVWLLKIWLHTQQIKLKMQTGNLISLISWWQVEPGMFLCDCSLYHIQRCLACWQ